MDAAGSFIVAHLIHIIQICKPVICFLSSHCPSYTLMPNLTTSAERPLLSRKRLVCLVNEGCI